jgi:predicted nucleic acid-binding protein
LKAGIDTNLLIYAEQLDEGDRFQIVRALVDIARPNLAVSVLTLGEFFRVLVRKAKLDPAEARSRVAEWSMGCEGCEVTLTALNEAIGLSASHQLHIWDALALSCCRLAGCEIFLSEDLPHGFTWRGIEVVNPFAIQLDPLLARLS